MDPLSITLGVLSALKVAYKGALETKEFIDGIKGAPTAVNRLSQDLTALYYIIGLLNNYFCSLDLRKQSNHARQVAQLVDLPIKNCIKVYTDITLFIRPFIKPSGEASTSKWKGIRWNFKEKEAVALQNVLISYKATLEIAVGVANLTTASHEIRDAKNEVKGEVRKQIKGLRRYLDAEQESVADSEYTGSTTGTDYNYALMAFLKDTDAVIHDAPLGLFPDGSETCEEEEGDDGKELSDPESDQCRPSTLAAALPVPDQVQYAGGALSTRPPFKVRALSGYSSVYAGDLSFPSGQIITVTNEEDEKWYRGRYIEEFNQLGREGIFPKSCVSDPLPEETPFLSGVCRCRRHEDAKHINHIVPTGERMRATADFDTNRTSEISVRKGEIVANIARIAPLWWLATNSKNECGFVPAWRLVALSDTEADSSNIEDPAEAKSRHGDVFSKWKRPVEQPVRNKEDQLTKKHQVRAVAEYDYEAVEENEVSVQEGETVTITHGPQIDDEWWIVTKQNGESGLMPASYLTLFDGYKFEEGRGIILAHSNEPETKEVGTKAPKIRAVTEWDLEAEEDDEVSVLEGNIVTVLQKTELDEEWWLIEKENGETGLYPASWLKLLNGYKLDKARGMFVCANEPVWVESFAAWSGKKTEVTVNCKEVESVSSAAVSEGEPAWKGVFAMWSGKKQDASA